MSNYLITFTEELAKEGYSIVKASVNTFFKSSADIVLIARDSYINTRFNIRLEDFAYEQENIGYEQKKFFYENIDNKKLNYLFELLDISRTSVYDLHAKILAKLYTSLIINGGLNYYESSLLSNIKTLTEEDFVYLHKLLKTNQTSPLYTNDSCQVSAINKFIQIGVLSVSESGKSVFGTPTGYDFSVNFMLNDFSQELLNILNLIIDE